MAFALRNIGGSKFVGGAQGKSEGQSESKLNSAGSTSGSVCGVWASEGRVYIAANQGKQLVETDSVPRSRWHERYSTLTENDTSSIVAVLPNPGSRSQIYIIYSNSITECMEHDPATSQWSKRYSFQLSNAKGAEILSIVLHPDTSMFFWCEKRASSLGLASCCVCMREVPENWDSDMLSCTGPIVAILHSCPVMSLYIIRKGVVMVPNLPDEEKRILFFWTFVPRALKVHVWNRSTMITQDKADFKSIILDLLPIWHSFPSVHTEYIISLTTHLTTLELLLLDHNYSLSYATTRDGQLSINKLATLCISPHPGQKLIKSLFAVGLYVGVIWDSGVIDIFESRSGTLLCTVTELTGIKLYVWTCSGVIPTVGVWSPVGIWELKSRSVSEVAEVIRTSAEHSNEKCALQSTDNENVSKENKTIADDDASLSFKHLQRIFSGPVATTAFLKALNMCHLAAKVALSSVISKVIVDNSEGCERIEKEILEILVGESFQSPVFALTLLYDNPLYKEMVFTKVQDFLHRFDNDSEEKLIRTALNYALLPFMRRFIVLAETYDNIIENSENSPTMDYEKSMSVSAEVKEILSKLSLGNPESQSLSRLSYLQSQNSRELAESVAQYMGLNSQTDDVAKATKLYHQRWRKLYRLEWKDGRWQKSCAALEDGSNPSLDLLCSILYNENPDWLLSMKENGMAVINAKEPDEQAEDHITQSLLDCLPALKVDPSPNSTHVHTSLLWTAGQEMQAMQVLVRHQMWSQALDFFTTLPRETKSLVTLFTMLLKAFLRRDAPREVLLKALALVPEGLCPYEILSILQENGPKCNEPFESNSRNLTVGDVRGHLQKLLT